MFVGRPGPSNRIVFASFLRPMSSTLHPLEEITNKSCMQLCMSSSTFSTTSSLQLKVERLQPTSAPMKDDPLAVAYSFHPQAPYIWLWKYGREKRRHPPRTKKDHYANVSSGKYIRPISGLDSGHGSRIRSGPPIPILSKNIKWLKQMR